MSRLLLAHVVAPEYPGYGLCKGFPSAESINLLAEETVDWLMREHDVALEHIILLGRSIGSGPACTLANRIFKHHEQAVGGLILHSPYKSISAVANDIVFLAGPLVIPNLWNNEKSLTSLPTTPLLILHGREDEVIKFYHGEELFKLAPTNHKRCKWLDDATHNVYNLVELLEPVEAFLHELELQLPEVGKFELQLSPTGSNQTNAIL
eukprot:Filipodium_phascolosomae@DN6123_c0_g1_i1.p1